MQHDGPGLLHVVRDESDHGGQVAAQIHAGDSVGPRVCPVQPAPIGDQYCGQLTNHSSPGVDPVHGHTVRGDHHIGEERAELCAVCVDAVDLLGDDVREEDLVQPEVEVQSAGGPNQKLESIRTLL